MRALLHSQRAVTPVVKLKFACFYERCADRTEKQPWGACSPKAVLRTGCIARQRDMSMKRSEMRMAPRTPYINLDAHRSICE